MEGTVVGIEEGDGEETRDGNGDGITEGSSVGMAMGEGVLKGLVIVNTTRPFPRRIPAAFERVTTLLPPTNPEPPPPLLPSPPIPPK